MIVSLNMQGKFFIYTKLIFVLVILSIVLIKKKFNFLEKNLKMFFKQTVDVLVLFIKDLLNKYFQFLLY